MNIRVALHNNPRIIIRIRGRYISQSPSAIQLHKDVTVISKCSDITGGLNPEILTRRSQCVILILRQNSLVGDLPSLCTGNQRRFVPGLTN